MLDDGAGGATKLDGGCVNAETLGGIMDDTLGLGIKGSSLSSELSSASASGLPCSSKGPWTHENENNNERSREEKFSSSSQKTTKTKLRGN